LGCGIPRRVAEMMYAKIFRAMYEGTLASRGPWQALVTFQQMLILADWDGRVDMTADHISRTTTIPLEIIQTGILALLEPDPDSRSPELEGRRITQISEGRSWGWQIVNFKHYRDLRTAEDRKTYHRNYYRDNRSRKPQQPTVETVEAQQPPLNSTHKDIDVDQSNYIVGQEPDSARRKERELAKIAIAYLNLKAGTRFPESRRNLQLVESRISRDGATEEQLQKVIDSKVAEWGKDPKMRMYLRPATLFGETNWSQYVGQLGPRGTPLERVIHVLGENEEGKRGSIDSFMHIGALDAVASAKRFSRSHSRLIRDKAYTKIVVQDTTGDLYRYSIAGDLK
jgi:uncharacterized phage protein (TIGR02220 family)